MIAFSIWMVFIVVVVLSVPIALAMEKRQRAATAGPAADDDMAADGVQNPLADDAGVVEGFGDDPFGGAVEVTPDDDPFAT